jgi:hypothetical protein
MNGAAVGVARRLVVCRCVTTHCSNASIPVGRQIERVFEYARQDLSARMP